MSNTKNTPEINQALISSDFFSKDISVDISKVFPMMVVATMSSGKSTLINALLGLEILPSENKACTARVYSILDDDSISSPKVYITTDDGYVSVVEKNIEKALKDANTMDTVKDVLILGQIKGVLNTDKSLLIIDTPGPNNSRDSSHETVTNNILEKLNGGLLLYVINATQMGISDDSKLLRIIKNHIEKNKDIKVLFVINKMDLLDYERESVSELIYETKQYIENHGIHNPNIIPVSALAANLFKKVLRGEPLTRSQYRDFMLCYELFKTSDIRMTSYSITSDVPNRMGKISVNNKTFRIADIIAALENTGIIYLEKYIQETQILSSDNSNDTIHINQ